MKVFKYPVQMSDDTTNDRTAVEVELPIGARILSVDFQGHKQLVVWALVSTLDADNPAPATSKRKLFVVNTGASFAAHQGYIFDDLTFLGTCTTVGGGVWHIFEAANNECGRVPSQLTLRGN